MRRHALASLLLAGCADDAASTNTTSGAETGSVQPCAAGETRECYDGPPGSQDVGPCRAGVQTCDAAGVWGECAGEVAPAPADCATVGDETCGTGNLCAGEPLWGRNFRGSYVGDQTVMAWGLAVDPAGDLYLAGSFLDTLDIEDERLSVDKSSAIFLVRFGPDGKKVWARAFANTWTYPDPAPVHPGSLHIYGSGELVLTFLCGASIDLGGGPLMGLPGAPGVATFTTDGALRWARRFDGLPYSLVAAPGPGGTIRLAGALDGVVDLGDGPIAHPGYADALIVELSSAGELVRSGHWGDMARQKADAIATAPDGDVVIAGVIQGDLDFGAGPLHSGGGDDVFLARLAPDLSLRWARSFPALGDQWVRDVSVDADDHIILAGGYSSGVDLGGGRLDELYVPGGSILSPGWWPAPQGFVARYDGEGAHVWSRRLGVTAELSVDRVSKGPDGLFVLSGSRADVGADTLGGALHGATNGRWFALVDSEGAARWRWTFAATDLQRTFGHQEPIAAWSPLGQLIVTLPGVARVDLADAPVGADGRDYLALAAFSP